MDISSQLAALREKSNPSTTSDSKSSTPLATYLAIYNKSSYECYTSYMEGARVLYKWLSPIDIPEIPEDKLPKQIPGLFNTYAIQQLAKILAPNDLARQSYLIKLITYITVNQI